MERGGSRSDAMADASPIQGERLGAYGTSAAGSQQRQAGEMGRGVTDQAMQMGDDTRQTSTSRNHLPSGTSSSPWLVAMIALVDEKKSRSQARLET